MIMEKEKNEECTKVFPQSKLGGHFSVWNLCPTDREWRGGGGGLGERDWHEFGF